MLSFNTNYIGKNLGAGTPGADFIQKSNPTHHQKIAFGGQDTFVKKALAVPLIVGALAGGTSSEASTTPTLVNSSTTCTVKDVTSKAILDGKLRLLEFKNPYGIPQPLRVLLMKPNGINVEVMLQKDYTKDSPPNLSNLKKKKKRNDIENSRFPSRNEILKTYPALGHRVGKTFCYGKNAQGYINDKTGKIFTIQKGNKPSLAAIVTRNGDNWYVQPQAPLKKKGAVGLTLPAVGDGSFTVKQVAALWLGMPATNPSVRGLTTLNLNEYLKGVSGKKA